MGFRCGIVGLPNVGKSTLFNALTQTAAAQAANYPFCTIEPNVGRVAVPDERLDEIARDRQVREGVETQIEFVDIAGLVRGAKQRRRPRQSVPRQHPRGRRDRPRAALFRRRRRDSRRRPRRSDRGLGDGRDRADDCRPGIARATRAEPRQEGPAGRQGIEDRGIGPRGRRSISFAHRSLLASPSPRMRRRQRRWQRAQLLTAKPVLYVCNVDEGDAASGNALSKRVFDKAAAEGAQAVVISAAIEAEIATLAGRRARGVPIRFGPQGDRSQSNDPCRL